MDHRTDSFLARGGVTIFTQTWRPPDDPKGLVVLVHGYGEHSGRYAHVAEAFVEAGIAVAAYDQRGHGRSGGPRALFKDFSLLAADLALFRQELGRDQGLADLPQVLLGHSLGGALVIQHLLDPHQDVEAVVLSGPYLRNAASVLPPLKAIAPILGRVVPSLPTQPIPPSAVSRDPDVVRAYEEDPLVFHGSVPAASAAILLRLEAMLMPQVGRITEPTLVLHGTEDQLADVQGSRLLTARLGGRAELKVYEGLYHEVFNEPERAEVIADVVGWVANELSPEAA